jgi:hypothetical protein
VDSRFLLVTRIGPLSRHDTWLHGGVARDFDVLLSAYDTPIKEVHGEGIHIEHRPGRKVEGYGAFLKCRRMFWEKYDYIGFWDEDLETRTEDLNELFSICADRGFKIAQPALTHDSHFTYAAFLQQRMWRWRHVNYIEMMCPIFRRDILSQIAFLYNGGYESGIDLIWCNQVYEGQRDFAVIDATPVRHCEPVGNNKAANGFVGDKRYEDDIYAILKSYNLPWLSCTPYSAVTASGREVSSRAVLFLAAVSILRAVPLQRPFALRLRAALVHLRHIVLRPARNIKVMSPGASRKAAGPEFFS